MPICRTCNKQWPEGTNVCPDDGFVFTMDFDGDTAMAASPPPPVTASATGARPAVVPHGSASAAVAVAEAPMNDDFPMSTELVAGMVVGEYRIDKKIGEGGMGAVYSATHPMIGKRAAIKVISAALGTDASAVNRFVQEARSVNQIGHPNIVDVFAFGELPDGRNYFVMEYLQGESLAERLGRVNMPLGEAIEILDQVADALEAAHEKQIVHRDLKPDNVYLAAVRGGRTLVKLLDFGIAKLSSPDSPGSGGVQKTRTGMMMGTPGYLSPEQARGKNVDHRTDIYALGCMVFEIVCGRLPFVADNAMDIVLMHMTEPAARPSTIWPEIPPQLDEVITRMLEKDPNVRPSLPEVRAVFSELVSSGLVTLNHRSGIAFGSGISRATPTTGMSAVRPTSALMAVGTQPQGTSPGTLPPGVVAPTMTAAEAPKKKTGLIAALAGVVVLGGAGAFFALKGGGDKPAQPEPTPAVAAAPLPTPTPTPPPPEPTKPVEKTVEAPKPGTIEIVVNVDNAEVSIDGKQLTVTGKSASATVESAGDHLLMVSAAGREPYEATVTTRPGEVSHVVAKLEKASTSSKKSGSSKTGVAVKTGTAAAKTGATGTTPTNTTTTATPTDTTTKKAPDVKKDATIDPFSQ